MRYYGFRIILQKKQKTEKIQTLISIEDEDIYKSIDSIAKNSFIDLVARDYGRIDIKMDVKGYPYFLETNLLPGMTQRTSDLNCSFSPGHVL